MITFKKAGLLALGLGMAFLYAPPSLAQIAPQTCSSGVWKTMEDRARLETQREIMQNQNLIFKADSVLSYTCFDKFAAHGAKHLGNLFTHTKYWNGTAIFPEGGANGAPGMGAAVQSAAVNAMRMYIQGNFNHGGGGSPTSGGSGSPIPLGGKGSELGLAAPVISTVNAGGADYSCGEMSRVWAVAKCMNFMHTGQMALTDGFYPFKSLAGFGGTSNVDGYEAKTSIRGFPTSCGSDATPVPGGWATYTNQSRNFNGSTYDQNYQFGTPTGTAFSAVRPFLEPATCGSPIRTGVQVILSPGATSSPKPDGVCTNAGCSYVNGRCVASTGGSTTPVSGPQ